MVNLAGFNQKNEVADPHHVVKGRVAACLQLVYGTVWVGWGKNGKAAVQ